MCEVHNFVFDFGSDTTKFGRNKQKVPVLIKTPEFIEKGSITDFEKMSSFTKKLIENYGKTDEFSATFIENILNSRSNRLDLVQVSFEEIGFSSMIILPSSTANLFSNGIYSGISLDIGHKKTYCSPTDDSFDFHNTKIQTNLGGDNITKFIQKILNIDDYKDANIIKESNYKLPDDQIIQKCSETLFDFHLLDSTSEYTSIIGMLETSCKKIHQFNADFTKLKYVIVSGGCSKFENLEKTISNKFNQKDLIIKKSRIDNSSWVGGSLLIDCFKDDFRKKFLLKEDYDETGPVIVFESCFVGYSTFDHRELNVVSAYNEKYLKISVNIFGFKDITFTF